MSRGKHWSVDVTGFEEISKELKKLEKEAPKATAAALNRTLQYASNQLPKIIQTEYAVKTKTVKNSISKQKANRGDLSAALVIKGYRLSFAHFPFTPKSSSAKGKRRNVSVTIKKESGKTRSRANPPMFVAPTGAKSADKVQYNVFQRDGKKRKPIHIVRTIGIPQMITANSDTAKQVKEKVTKMILDKFDERLTHELKFRMDKMAEKVNKG